MLKPMSDLRITVIIPVLIHTHIERSVSLDGEATLTDIILYRRSTCIQEHGVYVTRHDVILRQQRVKVTELAQQRGNIGTVIYETRILL